MSFAGRSVSPCFQYSVQSLGRDRFRFVSPYTTARLDKRQKNIFHTDIVSHPANTSEIRATKKPHNYHKTVVWQKDDRIRKRPLEFCGHYYSELSGDCQASIFLSFRCLIHRELNLKVPPLQTSERKLIFPKRKWNLVFLKDYNAVLWSDLLLRQNRRNPNGQIQTDDPGKQNHYRTRTR